MEGPKGDLMIRVLAMPKDTNTAGDIFGGWLLSQMDIAGGAFCRKLVKGRVATVAIESTSFKLPVFTGDTLCCYVSLKKKGETSITVHVEAFVNRDFDERKNIKVTEGDFVYVKIDSKRQPVKIEW